MPLDKKHITIASRVMLPTYMISDLAFGATFVIDPEGRLGLAPSLIPARSWLSLPLWGAMWLSLALLMTFALGVRTRWLFVIALALNVAAWGCWGIVVETAVLTQPNATYLAAVLPWFVAAASFASLLSLLHREA